MFVFSVVHQKRGYVGKVIVYVYTNFMVLQPNPTVAVRKSGKALPQSHFGM